MRAQLFCGAIGIFTSLALAACEPYYGWVYYPYDAYGPPPITAAPPVPVRELEMTTATLTRDYLLADRMADPRGAIVLSVWPGGLADRAGMKPGDVIQSFNGYPVPGMEELDQYVSQAAPGSLMILGVWRQRQLLKIHFTE